MATYRRCSTNEVPSGTPEIPKTPAICLEFKHFLRSAFIGMLNDLSARLNMPVYMLSTGDQIYWQSVTQNLASSGDIDDMLKESKNFATEVPRCVVSIESYSFKQSAITQSDTPIRLIVPIKNDSDEFENLWSVMTSMKRLPLDFSVNAKIFTSTWLLGLDMLEYTLAKLYDLCAYDFVWYGVINGGAYEFSQPSLHNQFNIMQQDTGNQAIIDLNLTLHLQYPAINTSKNEYELSGIIYNWCHGIEIPDIPDETVSNIDTSFNIKYIDTLTANDFISLAKHTYFANSGGNKTNTMSVNKSPFCSESSCKL